MISSKVTIHSLCPVSLLPLNLPPPTYPQPPHQDSIVGSGHFSSPQISHVCLPPSSHTWKLAVLLLSLFGWQQRDWVSWSRNFKATLRRVSLFFNNSIFLPVDSKLLLTWKISSLTASLHRGSGWLTLFGDYCKPGVALSSLPVLAHLIPMHYLIGWYYC